MKMKTNTAEVCTNACSHFNWMTVVTNLIWNLCVYRRTREVFGCCFFRSENSISWKWRERETLERKEARVHHHSLHLYAVRSSASYGIHIFLNRQCLCNLNECVLCCSTFHWATPLLRYVHSNEHGKNIGHSHSACTPEQTGEWWSAQRKKHHKKERWLG